MSNASDGSRKIIAANNIRQEGATVARGGAFDSTNVVTVAPTNATLAALDPTLDNKVQSQSTTANGDLANNLAHTTVSGRTFNDQVEGNYVMMAQGGMTVAGATDDVLDFTSADSGQRKGVNFVETIRTTHSITAGWNYATGKPSVDLTHPSRFNTNDAFGNDDAARAGSSSVSFIPGELAFLEGGPLPASGDYEVKTTR